LRQELFLKLVADIQKINFASVFFNLLLEVLWRMLLRLFYYLNLKSF